MSPKSQFFFLILILIVIAAVSWYFGLFGKTRDILFNSSADELGQWKKKTFQESAKEIIGIAAAIPQKLSQNIIKNTKEALLESAKEEVGSVIDIAQQKLGLAVQQANERPLAITLAGNINKPISFFVDGGDENSSYAVDWGDGDRLSGKVAAGEKKILEHTWRERGTYLVVAEVTDKNKEIKRYSFPIAIEP